MFSKLFLVLASFIVSSSATVCNGLICSFTQFCYDFHCFPCKPALPNTRIEMCRTAQDTCLSTNCLSCNFDSDCSGLKEAYCSSGLCVECLSDTDCSSPTPFCFQNLCVECSTESDCSSALNYCTTNQFCANCISNSECSGINPYCIRGSCVQCEVNFECNDRNFSVCQNQVCVPCSVKIDCFHLRPTYDCIAGYCQECLNNTECLSDPNRYCSPLYTCGECLVDADCPYTRRFCNTAAIPYACQACQGNSHCNTTFPSCVNGICVLCAVNADCSSIPGTICLKGNCLNCLNNGECSSLTTPYCISNVCSICSAHLQCATQTGGACCSSGTCFECCNNNECTSQLKSVCTANACVQCTGNTDCSHITGHPYCINNACVAVNISSECTSVLYPTPLLGQCVACSIDSECAHLTSTPYCQTGICVACNSTSCTSSTCFNGVCGGTAASCTGSYCTTTAFLNNCNGTSCSPCTTARGCSFTGRGVCSSGNCVECSTATSCTDYKPVCNNERCEPCTSSSQCTTYLNTRCEKNHECLFYCIQNSECSNVGKARCNTTLQQCEPCQVDLDCSHLSSTPYCVMGTCFQCIAHYHCSGSTPFCLSHVCRQCESNYDCVSPSASFCSGGACYMCSLVTQCTHLGLSPRCLGGTGCVQCASAADCPSKYPNCTSGFCSQCSSNSNCANNSLALCNTIVPATPSKACIPCVADTECSTFASSPYCLKGQCVQCFDDTFCRNLTLPTCTNNSCGPCTTDNSCARYTTYNFCVGGACTACANDTQCGLKYPAKPYCVSGVCKQCRNQTACIAIGQAICSAGGTCSPCTFNSECPSTLSTCTNGTCFQCISNLNCSALLLTPTCNNNTCVSCVLDPDCNTQTNRYMCVSGVCSNCSSTLDCPDTIPACTSSTCQQCTANPDCVMRLTTPACDRVNGVCVECFVGSDCASGLICASFQTCVECETSTDCNSSFPVCDLSSHTCHLCSSISDCTFWSPALSFCSPIGCVECKTNAECPLITASRCSNFLCTNCLTNSDCNHFPATPLCFNLSTCVQCLIDNDCPLAAPVCSGNICVSCMLGGTDCDRFGRAYCNNAGGCTLVPLSGCMNSSECMSVSLPVCVNYNCEKCLAASDCNKFHQANNCSNGTCVECISDADCFVASTLFCINNNCAQCQTDLNCTNPDFPVCSVSNFCRECQDSDENPLCGSQDPNGFKIAATLTEILFAASSVSILTGKPNAFLKQVSIMQILLSLLFFNVEFPILVFRFIRLFKVSTFSFIPNPFLWIEPDLKDIPGYTPLIYIQLKVSGILVKDSGHIIFMIVSLMILDATLSVILKPFKSVSKVLPKLRKIIGTSFVFKFVSSVSILMLIWNLCQMFYPHPDTTMKLASLILAYGVFFIFIGLSVYIFWVHRQLKGKPKSKLAELLKKYELLFEGFISGAHSVPKPFLAVIFGKTILMMTIIVGLYRIPDFQILSALLLQAGYLVLLMKNKPFVDKGERMFNLFTEIFLFIAYIIILGIPFGDVNGSGVVLSGYLLVVLAGGLVLFTQLLCWMEVYQSIKNYFDKKKSKGSKHELNEKGLVPTRTIKRKFRQFAPNVFAR